MKLTWPFCRHFILVSHNCPWCAGRDVKSLTWKPMSYRADARPVEIIRALLDMLPKDVDSLDIAEQRVARVLSSGMWGRACARMLPVVRAAAAYIEAGDKAREWNTVTNRDGRLGPHALPPTREHDALRAAVRAYLEAAGADA